MLFRAQTCRFDDAHLKLGNPLTGGQNRIRHSGMAGTRHNSDRLNRRDTRSAVVRVEKLDVFADTASIGVEIERSNPKS